MTVKGQSDYDPNDPYNTDYAVPNAVAATKTDTPVSVQVVPKAVINDQQAIGLDNVQRVEVLKGPAGMLFGRTQPGGLVNVTTKFRSIP